MEKKINKKDVAIEPVEGTLVVAKKEAKKLLKKHDNKVKHGDIDAFVCLKDINKIYPNGAQAVYDFNIDIKEHDFIVLVGPSGCGKSTTLRMIAGLEDITSGYLYINKVLSNYLPSKDRDISMVFQSYALYPQMTVFDNIAFPLRSKKYPKVMKSNVIETCDQVLSVLKNPKIYFETMDEGKSLGLSEKAVKDYLFSRLRITENAATILFDLKLYAEEDLNKVLADGKTVEQSLTLQYLQQRKAEEHRLSLEGKTVNEQYEILKDGQVIRYESRLTKEEIREKVFEAAKILDLGPYLDRRPKELSGGQMQRVALGRAIVRNARLFLMDEPLSNLDAKLRVQMRSEIVRIHEQIGATTIYVTHDQTEAMTMATKIAVMSKGWVQQIDTPKEIYSHPKNIFVATFIGAPAMNIFEAHYQQGTLTFANGYKIEMNAAFKKLHQQFYQAKIEDCKRMLAQNEFKKMHGLLLWKELQQAYHDGKEQRSVIDTALVNFQQVVAGIDDAHGEQIRNLSDQLTTAKEGKEIRTILNELRKELLTIQTISSEDLGKLHNAQAFNKDENKAVSGMFYQKRKKEPFWKRFTKNSMNKVKFSTMHFDFSNNLYLVAENLLKNYENALLGDHMVKVGVRPEHIHLNSEYSNPHKTAPFLSKSDIVELMGSELLVHSEWNNTEMIAKISTGVLVKPHTDVEFTFNGDKVLVFDASSGDTIQS